MMRTQASGGHFKGAAEGQEQSHLHLSSMGKSAQARLHLAKALTGRTEAPVAPKTPAAPANPAAPVPPALPSSPATPMMPSARQPGVHNYRAAISMAAGHHGVSAGPGEIHSAIDTLTQQGRFTPQQGAMLKAHQGPLVGQAGLGTMRDIANTLVASHMGSPAL